MFSLRALLKFDLASLEVVVTEPTVKPRFLFLVFLRSYSRASLQTFPSVIFYSYFFPTSDFPDFVDEDALAFDIAPNVSDSLLRLRNPIHSAEPPPEPVLLSPPPSSSP